MEKMTFKSGAIFLLAALFIGCAGPRLKVQSTPPSAQVFASQQSSKDRKLIGTTPLEISFKDLYEKVGSSPSNGEYLVLTLESTTLEPERIMLPPVTFGASAMNIKVQLSPKQDVKKTESILQRLHNAQKFAQAGQLERALIETDKALEVDPQYVRSVSMKGSIFYMQKNYDEATKWFEKALAIDATFDQAVKMITRIKEERK